MRPSPRHEMVHKGTDAAGMEEWRCPVCGRHFIVRWPPDYERLVLAEGDGDATHVGTRDQVGLSGLEVAAPPPATRPRPTRTPGGAGWTSTASTGRGTARPPEGQAVSAGSGGPAGSGSARRGRRNSAAAAAPAATATAATV